MRRALILGLLVTAAVVLAPQDSAAQQRQTPAATNTCIDCHSAMDKPLQVTADQFAADIHAQKGLSCTSCHGGNASSPDNAMDPKAGFRGHIDRKAVPALCGKCHADSSYMRQFNPSLRTDQLAQYQTSVHGKRLAAGDTKAAVCTDCHGVHGMRPATDSLSSVYPVNVAKTCSRCHSDRDYMKQYSINTDQFAGYSASVHQEAIALRGDLSAPTCTTCHGNHGAAPPGVAAVENVCSTCHVLQAQVFDKSKHKTAFAAAGMPGCVTCHSNHRILHPNDTMIGAGPASVCTNCHVPGDVGMTTGETIRKMFVDVQRDIDASDEVLGRAARSGMEVSEAQLEQAQARDALMKARVAMHSFDVKRVSEDVDAARKVTAKDRQAGVQALRERDYRRMGLSVSLVFIFGVLIGLKLLINEIESKPANGDGK